MKVFQTLGNKALWQREKTLFLTSRMAPIGCYGKVFQWVEEFDKFNGCTVCFNTSELSLSKRPLEVSSYSLSRCVYCSS